MAANTQKQFYGVVPVFKRTFLGIINIGGCEDPSIEYVSMICPDEETAIKYMALLNGGNYGLIDAPHGIPSKRLVDHWVMMKMSKYYDDGNTEKSVISNRRVVYYLNTIHEVYLHDPTWGWMGKFKRPIKVYLNRLYAEGCANA